MTSVPSRTAGLQQFDAVLAGLGETYKRTRNFDYGPERRSNVSMLSPYLTCRLLLESEVFSRVVEFHGHQNAQKYIDEILWRFYWKSWLDCHPGVWDSYQAAITDVRQMGPNDTLRHAINGSTGIECFDFWVEELVETGYLHNHARLWFASIWIFTLKLPWVAGAGFFFKHLLDGDVASNTLSWRWVAGLQTAGKKYFAQPDNIYHFTAGRFRGAGVECDQNLVIQGRVDEDQYVPRSVAIEPPRREVTCLLLHEEDLMADDVFAPETPISLICALSPRALGVDRSESVLAFREEAVCDALRRCHERMPEVKVKMSPVRSKEELTNTIRGHSCMQVVTRPQRVGPTRQVLADVKKSLQATGILWNEPWRELDLQLLNKAMAGYFSFRKAGLKVLHAECMEEKAV